MIILHPNLNLNLIWLKRKGFLILISDHFLTFAGYLMNLYLAIKYLNPMYKPLYQS